MPKMGALAVSMKVWSSCAARAISCRAEGEVQGKRVIVCVREREREREGGRERPRERKRESFLLHDTR